jgi:hypothetical protein
MESMPRLLIVRRLAPLDRLTSHIQNRVQPVRQKHGSRRLPDRDPTDVSLLLHDPPVEVL